MVGPNYKEPKVIMPDKFAEEITSDATITSLKKWWETFNDPNLNNIINKAIAKNYDLSLALERIEQTRAYYRIKKADLFPEIDATAAAIRLGFSQNTIITSLMPVNSCNLFQIGFDTIWEVDIFGKLRREKEAAFYEIQAYQENMRDVYITVISDAAKYYVDICALQNIIDLTTKKIEYQKNILSLTQSKKASGLDSKINVNEQIDNLKEEEEKLLYYSTILKQIIYKLAVILGEKPESKEFDPSEFKTIPIAENMIKVGLPSSLLRNRPDIRKAERQLAMATAKVGAAIAEFFPSFSLTGNSALQTSQLSNLIKSKSFTWALGSIMKWPIITFGRIRANVDVKKSEERQALIIYENTILKALEDVESSLVAYFNEQEKLKDIQKEVNVILENTFLKNDKYLKGINNYIDLLEQEKYLIEKIIKEKESQRTLCYNLIALYKALGGGEWPSICSK
jgi:NodT family efflux transporter outer membrane factor (OMF) lipoprotein